MAWLAALFSTARGAVRSRASLRIENLALRHQLNVLRRTRRRPRICSADRVFWSWLSRVWPGWQDALVIVQPETVLAWRRRKFREYWRELSGAGKPGRPAVSGEVRDLIRRMSAANPLWGAPHIVGELRMIGIDLPKSTVTFGPQRCSPKPENLRGRRAKRETLCAWRITRKPRKLSHTGFSANRNAS